MKNITCCLVTLVLPMTVAGEEIVVHTRPVEAVQAGHQHLVSHQSHGGHHFNPVTSGLDPRLTHVPTSALSDQLADWGGMGAMGGSPLFSQVGNMGVLPMAQTMTWGGMPSMMAPTAAATRAASWLAPLDCCRRGSES